MDDSFRDQLDRFSLEDDIEEDKFEIVNKRRFRKLIDTEDKKGMEYKLIEELFNSFPIHNIYNRILQIIDERIDEADREIRDSYDTHKITDILEVKQRWNKLRDNILNENYFNIIYVDEHGRFTKLNFHRCKYLVLNDIYDSIINSLNHYFTADYVVSDKNF